MTLPRFPRLEALLGVALDGLSYEHLARRIGEPAGQPLREDYDLDFKANTYEMMDAARREFADDVASMANARGGVIMIGVLAADGMATGIAGAALSEREELRMHQIVADLIAPSLKIQVRRLGRQGDPDLGCYLVAMVRSALAPHAVRHGESLRFCRRDGPRRRNLSESEVADAYRNRFQEAASRIERLATVHTEGLKACNLDDAVWLALTLVPVVPGGISLSHRSLQEFGILAGAYAAMSSIGDGPFRNHGWRLVTTGVRRVVIGDDWNRSSRSASGTYAELHLDGSAFVAAPVWRGQRGESPMLHDEVLVVTMAGLFTVAGDFAAGKCGARGECLVRAALVRGSGPQTSESALVRLGRFVPIKETVDEWGSAHPVVDVPSSDHTIDLDAAVASPCDRMIVMRMLLADVFQAFGLPEVPQISNEGHLRPRYWRTCLNDWSESLRVPRSNEVIDL